MSRRNFRNTARGRGGFVGHETVNSTETIHPSVLKQAQRSGILNLSQRNLTSVPKNIWTLQEDVPEEATSFSMENSDSKWWEVTDLTKFILASNQLTSISEDIENFRALTVLDLHDNKLADLPKALGSLERLVKLDLSRNLLSQVPAQVGFLTQLQTLHLEHNKLTSVCEDMCSLKKLEMLNLSNNQIETLPRYICLLSQLRSLNLSENRVRTLPPDIGSLDHLRIFDATHNQILTLPVEFGNLRNLEQLHLRHNQLECLPVLRHCAKLKEILAGNNDIRGLTKEHLEPLTTLTCLDLRDNKLQKIPDDIVILEKLERLDLTNNDISNLPYVLGTITSLKAIVLDGNPLRSIRRDIIMRGTMELKKYLVSRLSDDELQEQSEKVSTSNVGIPGADSSTIRSHELHQLKSLDFSQKKASSIPDDVVEAALEAGVKAINLNKNAFQDFPANLSVLAPKVHDIAMGYNKITHLSPTIGRFEKLFSLDLRNNQLSDLPLSLASAIHLRDLTLSNNQLLSVPEVVYSLNSLEILLASDNKITFINVDGLITLKKLGTLDLQNNNIVQVPPELGNMSWLKSLQLTGNAFRNPRPQILSKGTVALLEFLRSRIVTP